MVDKMIGQQLITKYCESINVLFEEQTFNLNIQFSEVNYPCYRTNGHQKAIHLPNTIESLEFDGSNLDLEYLTLIALGHETAHYLNEHSKVTEEYFDSAIELWADYFGGKILFTLFLHNDFFKDRYSFFTSPQELINNYYEGLCQVYEHYYSNNIDRYPSKDLRMQIGLTASTSVFSYFTNDLYNQYSCMAVKIFSENPNFSSENYENTQKEFKELFPKIIEVHKLILGEGEFISVNMKKDYLKYITTSYMK